MPFIYPTDLAIEAHQMLDKTLSSSLGDGIISSTRKSEVCVTDKTSICTTRAARALDKEMGTYVTLSFSDADLRTRSVFQKAAKELAGELSALLKLQKDEGVIVACLGNAAMTPDAIGPETARHILPTRHLTHDKNFSFLRPVCVVAPGVAGTTGLESSELIAAAARHCGASAMIAVDALASRSLERLCTTVQLSDTGISPGSGVGSARGRIDSQKMQLRVVSMGVPTVVSASTLAADVLKDAGLDPSGAQKVESSLFVTVKDIDEKIKFFSRLAGIAINMALQSELTMEDIFDLLCL